MCVFVLSFISSYSYPNLKLRKQVDNFFLCVLLQPTDYNDLCPCVRGGGSGRSGNFLFVYANRLNIGFHFV